MYQGQWNEEGVLGEMVFERGREGGERYEGRRRVMGFVHSSCSHYERKQRMLKGLTYDSRTS